MLSVPAGKVFLFDTADLDPAPRALSFLVFGVILLVASYAYARWQDTKAASPAEAHGEHFR